MDERLMSRLQKLDQNYYWMAWDGALMNKENLCQVILSWLIDSNPRLDRQTWESLERVRVNFAQDIYSRVLFLLFMARVE